MYIDNELGRNLILIDNFSKCFEKKINKISLNIIEKLRLQEQVRTLKYYFLFNIRELKKRRLDEYILLLTTDYRG